MTEVRILSVRNAEKGNKQFITLEKISVFESGFEWTRLNSNASALCRSTYHIAHTDMFIRSASMLSIARSMPVSSTPMTNFGQKRATKRAKRFLSKLSLGNSSNRP